MLFGIAFWAAASWVFASERRSSESFAFASATMAAGLVGSDCTAVSKRDSASV